jgi:hypothetical protein
VFVFALLLLLSWTAQRRLEAMLDRLDARTLDEASSVLDYLVTQQGKQLTSSAAVLSEDARIRAMVLTPAFDRATALDLLSDLKATSGASVVGILDSDGTVRAVVGAEDMDQLDLGTSSLFRDAIEKPSARVWAFADKVGVLSATAVRLDNQVRALFMMGSAVEDARLQDIERIVGATGALFVGDKLVASAKRDPESERALRLAAALPPGKHRIDGDAYLASRAPLSDSAASAVGVWLVPLHRQAEEMTLTRALWWLPVLLVGLVLAITIALVLNPARERRPLRN